MTENPYQSPEAEGKATLHRLSMLRGAALGALLMLLYLGYESAEAWIMMPTARQQNLIVMGIKTVVLVPISATLGLLSALILRAVRGVIRNSRAIR